MTHKTYDAIANELKTQANWLTLDTLTVLTDMIAQYAQRTNTKLSYSMISSLAAKAINKEIARQGKIG